MTAADMVRTLAADQAEHEAKEHMFELALKHLEHIRACFFGPGSVAPAIPEREFLERHFGKESDDHIALYRKALARRAKP